MTKTDLPAVQRSDQNLALTGKWITRFLQKNALDMPTQGFSAHEPIVLDFQQITSLDTNGACLIHQFLQQLLAQDLAYKLINITPEQQTLLDLVKDNQVEEADVMSPPLNWLAAIGVLAITIRKQSIEFLNFLGQICEAVWHWARQPQRIRWISIVHTVDTTGYQAMGIIALLSFLIGIVLCYQMGLQLETYGAGIYVVDFIGISVLREFGPLLTAIIVAGRTGAAFAAQIGTMKLNQEIDAINTMGLSSIELLILPKIVGLLIALPLLVVLAMAAGIFGGMVMAKILFSITYLDFLARFAKVILFRTLVLGMIKTPVFAILIASIGCFQGLKVSHSAESVGRQTTVSVVQAIFMIIVTDAFFSIVYSKLGL